MPLILRTIRKAKWQRHSEVDWLEPGELQADALGDLQTASNTLSVWRIDENRMNLDRVIAALAAGRDVLGNLDYALFDESALDADGIQYESTGGASPDDWVNGLHLDLFHLSASRLLRLAECIAAAERNRVNPKAVLALIGRSVLAGHLELGRISESIRVRVEQYLSAGPNSL